MKKIIIDTNDLVDELIDDIGGGQIIGKVVFNTYEQDKYTIR